MIENLVEKPSAYFVVGGTLTGSVPCYVERQADAALLAALLAGELCYVLDTRQVGKSSLIVHTALQLRAEGRRTVLLDLSTFGNAPTEEEWYGKLLADMARALDLEDEADAFWEEKARFSSAQRWFVAVRDLFLPRLTAPLVVFVDELEAVRKLPFSTDAFFAMVRALFNLRATEPEAERLTFCLAGVATPSELIRDSQTTPFNIGRRIALRDFTPAEAQALAQGLGGTPLQRQEQMQRIYHWTRGHPYLTQRFCQAAAEKGYPLNIRDMDALCRDTFLSTRAQSEEFNLHFVRRQLLDNPASADLLLRYDRLRAGRRVLAASADALTDQLLLSGVARIDAACEPPRLAVRNRLYAYVFDRRWIQANLPNAERRRQQKAVRRGVLRASIVWCAIAGLLLFALARQREVSWQQLRITGLNRRLQAEEGDLRRRTREVANAGQQLQVLNADIARQRREQQRLGTRSHQELQRQTTLATAMRQASEQEHRRLIQTEHIQRQATQEVHRLEQEAARIREDSEGKRQATLALMGAAVSGKEFEALEHGLKAVAPALGRHTAPSLEAVQGLGNAATAGVYRLHRLKHPFFLETSSFSADDRIVATAGRSRFVYLWDAQTGRQVGRIAALSNTVADPRVWTAEFSPDGKYLVTAGKDGIARVWDAPTLRQPAPRCDREISCAQVGTHIPGTRVLAHFSPTGKYLAVSAVVHEDGKNSYYATVWEAATRARIRMLRHDGEIRSLAFNIWSLKPEQGERYLAIAGGSHTARIYEFHSGQEVFAQDFKQQVLSVAFTLWSDGVYVSLWDGTVQSWGWNAETETNHPGKDWKPYIQKTYRLHTGVVSSVAASADGFLLASAGENDFAIHIWYRENTTSPIYFLRSHAASVMSVRFSHTGSRLVTASQDGTAEIWLLAAPLYTISGGPLHWLTLSPDGSLLAAPSKDYNNTGGRVFVWKAAGDSSPVAVWSRFVRGILNEKGGEIVGSLYHVAYSPDGKRLATAGDKGSVLIWNLKTPTGSGTHDPVSLVGHDVRQKVNCVAFSPDGRLLLSASDDQTVRLWDTHTGTAVQAFHHKDNRVCSVAFAPDGKEFLTGCTDGTAGIYDLNGRPIQQMQPPGLRGWTPQRYPWSVCFSPDGGKLLTGDADGNAYVWQRATGKLLATLPYEHGQVFCAQFSPDGRHVLTVGAGGYVVLWDVKAAEDAARKGQPAMPFLSQRVSAATLYGGQFSRDGQYVFVGGEDCLARRYPATVQAIVNEAQKILRLGNRPALVP